MSFHSALLKQVLHLVDFDGLWKDHGINLKTKIGVDHSGVIPTLRYASETWTPYRKQINTLDAFHMRRLRSILGKTWRDKMSNNEVLTKCGSTGIECMLMKSQLRWVGHVVRMEDSRIPKHLLLWSTLQWFETCR